MDKIKNLKTYFDKLPKELKIPFYYAVAAGLNFLAGELLNLQPMDFNVIIRVMFGNMLVVFAEEYKPRIENKK